METNNKSDLHAAECLILVIPSNPHPDIDWHVVIEIKHQSFTLAYKAEDRAAAEWMAEMLRVALEKCGARMVQANAEVRDHSWSGTQPQNQTS
jgi:hypothetical protein